MHQYANLLAHSTLFEGLSPEEINTFLDSAKIIVKSYRKNSFIGIADEPMEGIGILLEGKALLTRENTLGQRAIVTSLEPPNMFGEVLLFTQNPNWPATIQTALPSKVLFLPKEAFTGLTPGCEPFQTQLLINLLKDLSDKAFILTRKVHYLTIKSMRQKIFAYILDLYHKQHRLYLKAPHNRQEMADVLNVSRTALSRELGRLAAEGILEAKGRNFMIKNIDVIMQ